VERLTAIAPEYSHTQKAPLCLILYGFGLASIILGWVASKTSAEFFIAVGVGLLIALLGPAFHHLSVEDRAAYLAIRFGPLPLFPRKVQYRDLERVDVTDPIPTRLAALDSKLRGAAGSPASGATSSVPSSAVSRRAESTLSAFPR
jgi:hypothetical protein